jgi:hypothetical protein
MPSAPDLHPLWPPWGTQLMSVKATTAVWDHSQTVGTARLVMLAIADSANDAGWQSYDKQDVIARKAHTSTRAVERAVKSAVAMGELEVHRPDRSGRNQYSVMLPGLAIFEDPEAREERDEWYEKMALGRAEKTRQNRAERQANRRSEDPTPASGPSAEGPDTSVGWGPDTSVGSDPTPASGGDPTPASGLKGNQQLKPQETKDRNIARATEDFWSRWPHNRRDLSAIRTLDTLKSLGVDTVAGIETIAAALAEDLESSDWQRDDGRWIPNLSNWLRDRKWDRQASVTQLPSSGVTPRAEDREFVQALRDSIGDDPVDLQIAHCWHGQRGNTYVLGGEQRVISWLQLRYTAALASVAKTCGYDGLELLAAGPIQNPKEQAA